MIIRNNHRGFSLIEILIAIGIFATALSILMTQVEVSGSINAKDEKLLSAVYLANNKLSELEKEISDDMARGKFADETTEAGKFDDPFDAYSWQYEIKKVEIPVVESEDQEESVVAINIMKSVMEDISKAVREVSLSVTWGDETEAETFSLTTHVMKLE